MLNHFCHRAVLVMTLQSDGALYYTTGDTGNYQADTVTLCCTMRRYDVKQETLANFEKMRKKTAIKTPPCGLTLHLPGLLRCLNFIKVLEF